LIQFRGLVKVTGVPLIDAPGPDRLSGPPSPLCNRHREPFPRG